MKSYWTGTNKQKRKFFKDYASCYNIDIPDNADLLIATDDDGSFCGFSALVSNERFTDIIFFLVPEKNRRNGYGSFMLEEIENTVKASDIRIIRCVMPPTEDLSGIFSKESYNVFPGEREYAVSFGALHYSEKYMDLIAGKDPKQTKSLDECSASEKGILKDFFAREGIIDGMSYDRKLSSVTFDNDKVGGLFLCDRLNSGIVIGYMYASEEHPEYLLNGFRKMDSILSGFGEDAKKLKISFATGNDNELDLIKMLSGDVSQIEEIIREVIAVKSCLP